MGPVAGFVGVTCEARPNLWVSAFEVEVSQGGFQVNVIGLFSSDTELFDPPKTNAFNDPKALWLGWEVFEEGWLDGDWMPKLNDVLDKESLFPKVNPVLVFSELEVFSELVFLMPKENGVDSETLEADCFSSPEGWDPGLGVLQQAQTVLSGPLLTKHDWHSQLPTGALNLSPNEDVIVEETWFESDFMLTEVCLSSLPGLDAEQETHSVSSALLRTRQQLHSQLPTAIVTFKGFETQSSEAEGLVEVDSFSFNSCAFSKASLKAVA